MDSNETSLTPNQGKNLTITTPDGTFERYPVKTGVVVSGDSLEAILDTFALPHTQPNDMLFISEKIVAISQGRAFPVSEIKVSPLANFLVKFVYKSNHGIGIGAPATMELCIRECGALKVLFAAACSAVGKLFGKRGVFYNILGMNARAIDGPTEGTLPPYNTYAKMAPHKPHDVAKRLAVHSKCKVFVMDANDLGVNVLGKSDRSIPDRFAADIFRDNPLGQSAEQTPIAIVRPVAD